MKINEFSTVAKFHIKICVDEFPFVLLLLRLLNFILFLSVLLRFISGEFHIDEKRGRSTQTADKNDMKLNDKCVVRIRLYSVV